MVDHVQVEKPAMKNQGYPHLICFIYIAGENSRVEAIG